MRGINNKPLTEKDLTDLSDWGFTPVWTVEQAALLWGGIDPAFTPDFEAAQREHPQKYRRACIARQAFLGGIVQKTLTVYELMLFDGYHDRFYPANQKNDQFSIGDICTAQTLVLRDVITEWARRENCHTLRQTLRQKTPAPPVMPPAPTVQPAEPVRLIEYKPYQPEHDNPALTVALQISREIWDKQTAGGVPPKQFEVQELIKTQYRKITGVEPTRAEIERIDRIARPPCFKHQQGKPNG